MLDGATFLPGGGDDQLLLAVDDREEAVVVEGADVAGVQPAVVVDQRAGGLLLQVVAGGVDRAADQDLAVLAELDLHARVGAADGAELEPAGSVGGDGTAGLGHAVDVVHLEAEPGHELRDVERHRGGGGAGPGDLVEPEQQLEEPEDPLLGLAVGLLDLRRHHAADLLRLDPRERGGHRVLDHRRGWPGRGRRRAWRTGRS